MSVQYNGQSPTFLQRIAALFKAADTAPFPVMSEYRLPLAQWSVKTNQAYFKEGYKQNSAVFACLRALANGFAEAPLKC